MLLNKYQHGKKMIDYRTIDFGRDIDRFEREILDPVFDRIAPHIQMSFAECYYLNGVIRKAKPKRILEIGTARGGTAALMLNATCDVDDSFVVSLDYNVECYIQPDKQTGWIVPELFPELASRWKFKGGGYVCQYLDEISRGEKFDMLFLDTTHSNPGEFLHILEALPYLKDGAIVVLHDTALYTALGQRRMETNQILLATLKGRRILFDDPACPVIPNIGGIVLDPIDRDTLWGLFSNTALPWVYPTSLPEDEYALLLKHYYRHYDKDLVAIFDRSANWHRQRDALIHEIKPPKIALHKMLGYAEKIKFFGKFPLLAKRTRDIPPPQGGVHAALYLFGAIPLVSKATTANNVTKWKLFDVLPVPTM